VKPLSHEALRASEVQSFTFATGDLPAAATPGEPDSVIQSPSLTAQGEDAPSVVVSQPDVSGQYSPAFEAGARNGSSVGEQPAALAFARATASFDQAHRVHDSAAPTPPPPPMVNNFLGLRQEPDLQRFAAVDSSLVPVVVCAVDEEIAGSFALLLSALSAVPVDDALFDRCFRECVAKIPTLIEKIDGPEAAVSVNAEAGLRRNAEAFGGMRSVSFRDGPLHSQYPGAGGRGTTGVSLETFVTCIDLVVGCLAEPLVVLEASTAEHQVRLEDLGRTLVDEWPVVRGRCLSPARASGNLVRGSSARFLSAEGGRLASVGQFTSSIEITDENAEAVAADFVTSLRSWCALVDERRGGSFTVSVSPASTLREARVHPTLPLGAVCFIAVAAATFGAVAALAESTVGFACLLALAVVPIAAQWGRRVSRLAAAVAARSVVARHASSFSVSTAFRSPITGGATPRTSPFTKGPCDSSFSDTDVLRSGFLLSKRSQGTLNTVTTLPGSLQASVDGDDFTRTSVARRRGSATPNPLSQMLDPVEEGVVRVRMDATGTLLLPFMDDTNNPIVLDGFHVHTHLSVIGVEFSTVYATAEEQRSATIPDDRCYVCLWNHAIVSATGGFTDKAVLSNNLNDVLEDVHSVRSLAQRIAAIEAEVLDPCSGFSNAPLVLSFLHREHGAIKMRMTVAPVTQAIVAPDGTSADLMVGALLIGVPIDVRASLGGMTLRNRYLAEAVEQFYLEATAHQSGSSLVHQQQTEANEVTFAALLESLAKVEPMKDHSWTSVNSRCLLQELPRAMVPSIGGPALVQLDPVVPEVIDIDLESVRDVVGAISRAGDGPKRPATLVSVSTPNSSSSVLMIRVVGCDASAVMSNAKDGALEKSLRAASGCVMLARVPTADLAEMSVSGNALTAQRSMEPSAFSSAMATLEELTVEGQIECIIALVPYRRSTGGEVGWLSHVNAAEASDSPVLRRQGSLRVGASMSMSASLATAAGTADPMSVMVCRSAEIERHKIALALWHRSHSVVQIEDDDFLAKGCRIIRSGMRRIDAVVLSRHQPLSNDLLRFCGEFPDVAFALEVLDSLSAPQSLPGSRMRRRSLQSGSESDAPSRGGWNDQAASGSAVSNTRPQREIVLETLKLMPNVVVVIRPSHAPRFAMDLVQAVGNLVRTLRGEVKKREAMESLLKQRRSMPWEKGRMLGKGTFGDVHEAKMTLTGGLMAVKTMRCGNNQAKQEALLNEIKVLLAVHHPNIVHYFHSEKGNSGEVNIFMELCSGGSLAGLLSSGARLDVAEVASFLQQIVAALEYMHVTHDLAHRDLKPANVLLSNGKVKLADFGTAAVTKSELTDLAGTMQYMAPEVFAGEKYGKPCDIWSVGVICLDLLRVVPPALDKPHIACLAACNSDDELWNGLQLPNAQAHAFVRKCLRVDPRDRHTATNLLQDDFLTAPIRAYGLYAKETGSDGGGAAAARRVSDAGALSFSDSGDAAAAPAFDTSAPQGDFAENANQWKSRFMHSTSAPSPAKGAAHRRSMAQAQPLAIAVSPAARAKRRQENASTATRDNPEHTMPIPPTPHVDTAQPSPAAGAPEHDAFADVRNDGLVVQDSVLSDF